MKRGCPGNLRRLVSSYLENRQVTIRYAGREYRKQATKGCIQSLIGGPTFWNLLLDPLLDDLEKRGLYYQTFADNIILVS